VNVKPMIPAVIQSGGLVPAADRVGVAGAVNVMSIPFTDVHPPTVIFRLAYASPGAETVALFPDTTTLVKLPPSYVTA